MKRSLGLALFITLGVASCGGSESGGNGQPFVPSNDLTITGSNGERVARATYLAAAQSGETAGLVGTVPIAVSPGGVAKVSGELARTVQTAVNQVPIGPQTVPCAVDGVMTFSGEIQNPLALSVGDKFRVEASNCDDGQGEIVDGIVDFTVEGLDGDIESGLYELAMALDLIDFQVTTANDVLLSNGDATATVNSLESPFIATSVRGSALTVDSNSGSETLVGFLTSQTIDGTTVPAPFTMTASGKLDSTQIGGTVDYSTPVRFEGFDVGFPHTGELRIEGMNNTSVRLIAVDDVRVMILIDSSGNGEPDETIETTWDALLG